MKLIPPLLLLLFQVMFGWCHNGDGQSQTDRTHAAARR